MPDKVLYEARDGVAWITLNRPDVHNAIDLEMRDALWALLDAAEADDDVGVVVFRGAGDAAFSAGADISEFGTAPSYTGARRSRQERDLWGRVLHFAKPTIAAIHGYALGAGCELSLLCDFRIAAEDARIGLPEAKLGYIPTAGGTQTLQRTIGPGRALDMLLTAEPVSAQTALDYGLVHRVVPATQLDAEAEALARRLLSQPAAALQAARRALVEGADLPLATAIRLESHLRQRF
ncbi:MAG TPA: enoyl-CoA hydratase/isomerase family protein [Dehalococcoidia bacterium]|nr:enoyl-CoA hydratase/isomerase family protein [Dehalococcoidia bacterium]